MKSSNVSLQIVPLNTGESTQIIDAAIEVIQQSGIRFEVHPFSTVMEGPLDQIMDIITNAKKAAFEAGGEELLLNIQIHVKKSGSVSWEEKVGKWKQG